MEFMKMKISEVVEIQWGSGGHRSLLQALVYYPLFDIFLCSSRRKAISEKRGVS
jgi:hypothetical protein